MKQDLPSCHRERKDPRSQHIEQMMHVHRGELGRVVEYAGMLKAEIEGVSDFIQLNTSAVCPACEKVCCINRHGRYESQDLIYIFVLGLELPAHTGEIHDSAPCRFLSGHGCRRQRSQRPFRCNWYFCDALLAHMERGPAKPYREFIGRLQGLIATRGKMIDEFTLITGFRAD